MKTSAGDLTLIIAIAMIIASTFLINTADTGPHLSPNPYQQFPDHANVPVVCDLDLYVSDHHCVSRCPAGFGPGHSIIPYTTVHIEPIFHGAPCMKSDGTPVSIYDLAGWLISSDNGTTIYSVVPDIPLAKVLVDAPGSQTLLVSPSALYSLATLQSVPNPRTEIATVRDEVGTFKILYIDIGSVRGDNSEYINYAWSTKGISLHVGDPVDLFCIGYSGKVAKIDFLQQAVVFTVPSFCS